MNTSHIKHFIRAFALAVFLSAIGSVGVVAQSDGELEKWRMDAEQGDADGQYNLGVMYGNGEGMPRNRKLAVQWYRKAAEQGDANRSDS